MAAVGHAHWAFHEPTQSTWVRMSQCASSQLEAAFADPGCMELELSCGGLLRFRVDLLRMVQTNVQTGFKRAISRQCTDTSALVWEWLQSAGVWMAYGPSAAGQLAAAQATHRNTCGGRAMHRAMHQDTHQHPAPCHTPLCHAP